MGAARVAGCLCGLGTGPVAAPLPVPPLQCVFFSHYIAYPADMTASLFFPIELLHVVGSMP